MWNLTLRLTNQLVDGQLMGTLLLDLNLGQGRVNFFILTTVSASGLISAPSRFTNI